MDSFRAAEDEKGKAYQGTQPILFGTDVAFVRIVSDAELVCKSRDGETWRRRGEDFAGTRRRFSERAAANGPTRSNEKSFTGTQHDFDSMN